MNLKELVFFAVVCGLLALTSAKRVPASSPMMWGYHSGMGKYYKGRVVAKEDDNTAVYFRDRLFNVEFTIPNSEYFHQYLVNDIDPKPSMVYVNSGVIFEYSNYNTVGRYQSYVITTDMYSPDWQDPYKDAVYKFLVSPFKDDSHRAQQPQWVHEHLKPTWVGPKDYYKMRHISIPRRVLCVFLDLKCQNGEQCFLLDDFLPIVGCKPPGFSLNNERPTWEIPTLTTTTPPTTTSPPTTTTPPPPPTTTAQTTTTTAVAAVTFIAKKVNPNTKVDETEDHDLGVGDDVDWLNFALHLLVLAGGGVFVICLITCIVRYIRKSFGPKKTTAMDQEAPTVDKHKKKEKKPKQKKSK